MTTEIIHAACVALAQSMLSPEQFGHAVTAEVRDAARKALGRAPVEQAQYLNVLAITDEKITELAVEHLAIDCDRIPSQLYLFARALLAAAPADHVRGATEMVVEATPVAAEYAIEKTESLPCPFCGGISISEGEVLTTWGIGGTATQSMCQDCGALGPEAKLFESAIDYGDVKATTAWNRRTAAPQQPAPAVGADAVDAKRWRYVLSQLKHQGFRVWLGSVSISKNGNWLFEANEAKALIEAEVDRRIARQAGEQS